MTQIRLIGNAAALVGSAVYGWRWRDAGGVGGSTRQQRHLRGVERRDREPRGLADPELGGEVAGDVDAEVQLDRAPAPLGLDARAAVVGGITAAGSVPSRTPCSCSHSIRP